MNLFKKKPDAKGTYTLSREMAIPKPFFHALIVLYFCAGSRIFLRFQKAIDTIVYRDHARDGKGA
jgi:hypothetical protein